MNKRILNLLVLLLFSATAYSQAVTMTTATGGLAGAAQIGGTPDIAILGIQLNKATGGGNTVTSIIVGMTPTPVGKFTNARLYESADATFAGIGSETFITNGTISATDISFTGAPLTSFDGATAAADDEYFFVVVDVSPTVTTAATTTPSLVSTGVTASTGTVTGTTITGATYTFTALEADFTQNADDATALADEDNVTLLDFTINSNGIQTVNSTLTFTFNTDVTNILENFDLQVGGINIAGAETYPLTGGGTILTVTGFTSVDVTNATTFTLLADIKAGATSANDFTVSLVPAGVTISAGVVEAFGTFSNPIDVTGLEADFTQNADDATALADEDNVTLLDFTVNSSGTQSINSPLTFTFNTDITNILENFDLQVGGINIAGAETYPLTGGGTILTVTGFTSVDVTNATTFTLLADIKAGATSANDFTVSLVPAGVTISAGVVEAFGTISNPIDVTGLEADFTQNTDDAVAFADQNSVELLDFTVNSNGTQTISPNLVFTFNTNVTSILENWDLRVSGADIPGTEIYTLNGGGTQLTISGFTGVDVTNATNFQLFADIQVGVTTSNDFTISLVPGGVTIAPGTVEAFGTFSNAIDIVTSQASDIILNGSTTASIAYEDFQDNPISGFPNGSTNLGDYIIRDGGASNDGDTKSTIVTSIELQITHAENLRQIVLYDDSDDTEISGTQQSVSGTGTITIVFTPSTPINVPDNGTFEFKVRASFQELVTDNHAIQVSVVSVTAGATGSGFSPVGSWASTQTASNTNVIAVVATKYIVTPSPTSQTIAAPITITVQAVDDVFENRDHDFTGTITLQRSPAGGTFTAAQGFTQSLVAGQFIWTNVQFSTSNTYTITANDNPHGNALENGNVGIVITASSSTITQPSALNLCFGGSFQTLGNIVITETDAAGFSNSGTFSIALPTGFVFDTGGAPPTLSMSNSTTTFSAQGFTGDNIFQFNYSIASPTGLNDLTIGNLRIRYPGSTAPSGGNQITRAGGTAIIAGVGAGVQLGTVNAALGTPPGSLGFTVVALAGDVAVDPNQTNFSINGNAVQLVGTPSGGVFSGSGVTQVSSNYRFNPSSLSAGTYPITYTYTNPSGQNCQFTFSKNFIVYSSGINNLGPLYCTNDAPTGVFSVDATFLNSIGPNLEVSRYVYYDFDTFSWINITNPSSSPASTVFNPGLAEYQPFYNKGLAYGYPVGILIGFYVADATTHVESGFGRWQVVEVRPAPTVTFTSSSNTYTFCEDNPPVTLIGSPVNSNNTTLDRFDADGNGVAAVNHSIVAGAEVWTFSPAAVTGVGPSTPQTFNIAYKYTDPVTTCDATFVRSFRVKDRPSSVVNTDITDSPFIVPHTAIELCQGGVVGSFSAPNLGSPLNAFYTWYSDAALTTAKGRGDTFIPPIDNTVAQTNKFYVTQTTQREAIIIFGTEIVFFEGCESDKGSAPNPLELDVIVNPTPAAPTIANATKAYCINETISDADLAVGGTGIKWYTGGGTFIPGAGASPTALQLGIDNTVAGTYTFYATQTLNGCEGTIPASALFVTITIKPLPVVSVIPDNIDPMKICKTGSIITFRAFDGSSPALQPPGTISWTGVPGLTPQPGDGIATLNPATPLLTPADYVLTVTYTTGGTNCSNTTNLKLRVLPTVNPSVSIGTACDSSAVSIDNTSQMVQPLVPYVPAAAPSSISKIEWTFGNDGNVAAGVDGSFLLPIPANTNAGRTTGTYKNPLHRFEDDGSYQLSYKITTSDGCLIDPLPQSLLVSPKPKIYFTWEFPCRDITTGLSSTTFNAIEESAPVIPISTYQWNFGTIPHTPGNTIISNPIVTYSANGQGFVELMVTTAANCKDTIRRQISILPTYDIIETDIAYEQNFNSGTDGWIIGGTLPSWGLATTQAGTQPSDGAAWATGPAPGAPNNDGEQSWVMSGCFNLSNVSKPVISMDVWSFTPAGVDGAVLQYNVNGEITNEGSWSVLGQVDQGINWYDDSGIANSPGNQASGDRGWTGEYPTWKKAIYKLDEVGNVNTAIFRVAFAGGNRRLDGFAFDNILIGERSRVVLLENFTNTSAAANETPLTSNQNTKYANPSGAPNGSGDVSLGEIVKIQYHVPFPGSDLLNEQNQQMHNSRAAFYGITTVPAARVDGGYDNGNFVSWFDSYNDDRVLTPSVIKLEASAQKVGTDVKINVTLTNTTSQALLLDGFHLFTVIVQKEILKAGNEALFGSTTNARFAYVAKQMLPTTAGIPLNGSLAGSAVYPNLPEITWSHPNGGDAIVVFVQQIDGDNKNVLQAYFMEIPPLPDVITDTEDPEYANHIYLYPNPANNNLSIELPGAVNKPTPVALFDAFGRMVQQTEFKAGERTKTISTANLANGIYMMQVITPQGSKAVKKVMVKH